MSSRIDLDAPEPRAYTSYRHLIHLHTAGLHKSGLKPVQAFRPQTGITRSQHLGRGLEFAELKPYQPGDDTRHMDWKATARTGTPWLRAFEADQQRAVTCIVDQTSDLFFGSKVFTKALVAAELAALCCWDHLALGYSTQLVLQTDQSLELGQTMTNAEQLSSHLRLLADYNQALRAFQVNAQRDNEKVVLEHLSRQTQRQDVYWFSSPTQWQNNSTRELAVLGQHHDIHLVLICDPWDTRMDQLQGFDLVGRTGRRVATSQYKSGDLSEAGQRRADSENSLIADLRGMGVAVYPTNSVQDARQQYRAHYGFGRFEV